MVCYTAMGYWNIHSIDQILHFVTGSLVKIFFSSLLSLLIFLNYMIKSKVSNGISKSVVKLNIRKDKEM